MFGHASLFLLNQMRPLDRVTYMPCILNTVSYESGAVLYPTPQCRAATSAYGAGDGPWRLATPHTQKRVGEGEGRKWDPADQCPGVLRQSVGVWLMMGIITVCVEGGGHWGGDRYTLE